MTLTVRCVCVWVSVNIVIASQECEHRGCTGGAQGARQGRPAGPPQPRSLIKLSTGDPWRPSQSTRAIRSIRRAFYSIGASECVRMCVEPLYMNF